MPDKIQIAPNVPLYVALVDPNGEYDDGLRQATYLTTTGQILTLPRPAVVMLNMVEPRPGEEIQIVKHWTGKHGDSFQWTVALSTRSEQARATQGEPDSLMRQLEASIEALPADKRRPEPPIEIAPPKKQPKPGAQPRLFDQRGTGTHGPAPAVEPESAPILVPVSRASHRPRVGGIPMNTAFAEITAFVCATLKASGEQWSDQSRQDFISTVFIAAQKERLLAVWERGE